MKPERRPPGIDLILGSHSHRRADPHRIDGTSTWHLSPYQYGAYVSRVRLVFEDRRLVRVEGSLVVMDASRPQDEAIVYVVEEGRAARVEVAARPCAARGGLRAARSDPVYTIATTDYQAFVAGGYRELFAAAAARRTDLDVHTLLKAALRR